MGVDSKLLFFAVVTLAPCEPAPRLLSQQSSEEVLLQVIAVSPDDFKAEWLKNSALTLRKRHSKYDVYIARFVTEERFGGVGISIGFSPLTYNGFVNIGKIEQSLSYDIAEAVFTRTGAAFRYRSRGGTPVRMTLFGRNPLEGTVGSMRWEVAWLGLGMGEAVQRFPHSGVQFFVYVVSPSSDAVSANGIWEQVRKSFTQSQQMRLTTAPISWFPGHSNCPLVNPFLLVNNLPDFAANEAIERFVCTDSLACRHYESKEP